jgi:hypothetical protein
MITTVELAFDSIRVRFDGVLHLHIKRSDLLAVQAWRFHKNYTIQFTLVGGTVVSEYENEANWLAILAALDKVL